MSAKSILKKVKSSGRKVLTLEESRTVLESYKIPFAKCRMVKSVEEAANVAKKIVYPIVLKIVSKDIIHKTDIGGRIVDIKNESELQTAYKQIISNVKKHLHKARIDGMLVQSMVKDGQEMIIGGKKDEQFGQTILFGMGGLFTEIYEDTSLRVLPISRKDAEEMIKEIKGYKILKGYRGKVYDTTALVEILLKTAKLLEENQMIKELDINPVMILRKGVWAVDARIVVD